MAQRTRNKFSRHSISDVRPRQGSEHTAPARQFRTSVAVLSAIEQDAARIASGYSSSHPRARARPHSEVPRMWVLPVSLSCPSSLLAHWQQKDRKGKKPDREEPCTPACVAGNDLEPVKPTEDQGADAQGKAEPSDQGRRSGSTLRAVGRIHGADVTKGGTRQGSSSCRCAS